MKDDAAYEDALLRAAIESYATGYRRDPGNYYSGINALTLMHLHQHLTKDTRYEKEMDTMAGAVRFAAEMEVNPNQAFLAKATLGNLEVLVGTPDTTKGTYKEFIAKNDNDWFALNSCRAQLQLLNNMGYRLENVEAGIAVIDRALQRLAKPNNRWQPRQVFLFSGHMIDKPGRQSPRFPASKEPIAAQKVAEALQKLEAGPEDLALTQGACGGDLLFTEACQKRGVKVQWLQSFNEPEFIQRSVVCYSESWRERYLAAKVKLSATPTSLGIRAAPECLGPLPKGVDPYERCNLWLLYTSLSYGINKVWFICLWNGGGSDGQGALSHMYEEVNRRTGRVTWIDSREL